MTAFRRSVIAIACAAAFASAGCGSQNATAPTSVGLGRIGQIGVGRPLASESSDPATVFVDFREDSGRLNLRFVDTWDVRRVDIVCERYSVMNIFELLFHDVKPPAPPNDFAVDDYSRLIPERGIFRCTLTREDNTPQKVVIRFSDGELPPVPGSGPGSGPGGQFSLGGNIQHFAMLAGAAITCTGGSTVTGDVGVSPSSSITGFPGNCTLNGSQISVPDSVAAKNDLAIAYATFIGRPCANIAASLDGVILGPGVYCVPAATTNLTTAMTLTGGGEYVFKFASTFITSGGASVNLLDGAACGNVQWVVQSSATLAGSLSGNVIAFSSITMNPGSSLSGRTLALNGAVDITTATISKANCS